jgi:hypothetical protein
MIWLLALAWKVRIFSGHMFLEKPGNRGARLVNTDIVQCWEPSLDRNRNDGILPNFGPEFKSCDAPFVYLLKRGYIGTSKVRQQNKDRSSASYSIPDLGPDFS